ncbi:unnamed protein product [Adineta ricciae]|uniref:Uncharacterized protein n=1 Tax=Adineta ricciae TaxID=249248 RepID=A0A813T4A2_ADIRI|nr:unnamed protein product [Adineta ricciae]
MQQKQVPNQSLNIPFVNLSKFNRSSSNFLLATLGAKSYGTITFRRNYSNRANFIRIPPDAPPTQVRELFFRQRQHHRPALVISVTGSVREYSMKSKLFRTFRQGLLKVAKTTDVWLLTNGISTSVTKLIGEISRTNPDPSRPIHLIGIAPWGCVSGVEQLDVHGVNVVYNKPKTNENNQSSLERNHAHFIFIDDGTKQQFGGEVQFRGRFEKSISGESCFLQSSTKQKSTHTRNIPVVLIVIEGGFDTIKKIHETVMKNQIPVVLLEGTGGCCDLFGKFMHLYDEYDSNVTTNEQTSDHSLSVNEKTEFVKTKLREKLQINDSKLNTSSSTETSNATDGTDYFQLIYECIHTRRVYLNFIDLKLHSPTEADLDLAILQALLNVTSENDSSNVNNEYRREQLNLAFEWKRIDIVKNFIMKDERDWKTIDVSDLFIKALQQNQASFIQLFLDHDFPLDDLFQDDDNRLIALYETENYQITDNLNHPLRSIYHEIIQPLIGDFFQADAIFDCDDCSLNDSSSMMSALDAEKELFLWSVITGKQDLALLFWARGKNKICAALIATLLYKSKARKEKDEHYIEWADEFQSLAVEILEKFYVTNTFECTQAIIREIPQFGNVTWLHLAVMAEAKLFIAEKAVQDVLSDIWYGYIDHRVGNKKIVMTSFLLFYSGFLPYHKELVEGSDKADKHYNYDDEFSLFSIRSSRSASKSEGSPDAACAKLMDDNLDEEEHSVVVRNNNSWKRLKCSTNQYLKNVLMFLHAPCIKYLYSVYFHMIFLMLFSYVILFDFFPLYDFVSGKCLISSDDDDPTTEMSVRRVRKRSILNKTTTENPRVQYGYQQHTRPSATEIVLIVWMFTLLCEEIRQIFAMEVQSILGKLFAYIDIFWNKLDVLAILLFFIAFVLRFIPVSECFCTARIILAIDLSIWYIRTLDTFSAVKRLGPKLVMIGEMVYDMKFYMVMLTVFILAYGVPTYSLMYGVEKFSWHIPRAIINIAYWQIFGELTIIDEIERNYEIGGYVVFFLLIAYMTVASVLLINLLIAMFSNTFDRLHMDTDCIWKFQHYSLVSHYLTRPCLPPPLVIFSHIYQISIYCFSHMFHIKWFEEKYIQHQNQGKFKIVVNETLTKKIEGIEDAIGNEVYYLSLKTDRKQIDRQNDLNEQRVHSPQEIVLNKIKILENQIQTIENHQSNMFEYLEYLMNGIKKIGGDDIEMPKQRRADLEATFWARNVVTAIVEYDVIKEQEFTFGQRNLHQTSSFWTFYFYVFSNYCD